MFDHDATDADRFAAWAEVPIETIRHWETVPLRIGSDTAGVAVLSGTEIHFALDPEWRGLAISRRRVREFLTPLLQRRGFLTTRAHNPTRETRDFLIRLGFASTWTEPPIEHFMMCEAPYPKGR